MTTACDDDADGAASSVFAGLVPSTPAAGESHRLVMSDRDRSRLAKSMFSTVPILLVGSMAAMTLNLTGPIDAANAKPLKPKDTATDGRLAAKSGTVATLPAAVTATNLQAPPVYSVATGDTVSDIAVRFGLSTASVLALNGLSWSSMIFPGQQLKLVAGDVPSVELVAEGATPSGTYTIVPGDTISAIADRFGVSTFSVLATNGLGWASIIYPGQTLAIPGLIGPGTPSPAPAPEIDPVIVSHVVDDDHTATDAPVAQAPVVPPPSDAAPAPAPAPAPVITGSNYTIQAGDTLSSIAAHFGISTQALLDANDLDWSSVIFSGHTLVVPGSAPAADGGSVVILDDDMRANASVIVQVGRDLGVPDYGIVVALATAMQESSMRNLNWGDLDSVGLFQQRPSSGWGSVDLLTTPSYAARLFYGGPSNPNAGYTRGLLDISGWQSMSVTQAAQRVQISGYPDAYAKWEASARAWLAQLG